MLRRNQGQLGYLRYIFVEEKHRLWGEVGYDLTSDNYRQLPDKPPPPKKTDVLHSARAFIGYDNKLNDAVTYLGGVEVLVNLTESKHTRVAWDNALRSSLAGALKLEVKFRLAYDQAAPADRKRKEPAWTHPRWGKSALHPPATVPAQVTQAAFVLATSLRNAGEYCSVRCRCGRCSLWSDSGRAINWRRYFPGFAACFQLAALAAYLWSAAA